MPKTVVLGAGPAGLAAAYHLANNQQEVLVLEKEKQVGGLSKTINYQGYNFDIGVHRFLTKSREVDDFWHSLLNQDFLTVNRLSRVYYNKKFFKYPLRFLDILLKVGFIRSAAIIFSWLKAKFSILDFKEEKSFADWVSNRFGKKLFETFFRSYTEKVWGISAGELSSDWAAQRIKNLSLVKAIASAVYRKKGQSADTLAEKFNYPKLGTGMMYEEIAKRTMALGGRISTERTVREIHHQNYKVEKIITGDGPEDEIIGDQFISTIPLNQLITLLKPEVPSQVLLASQKLKFRDFIGVNLIVNKTNIFPDNWLYIHDPDLLVGRIVNGANFSKFGLPDSRRTPLGLEYFCFAGDSLWQMSDNELIALAKKELAKIGLADQEEISDGFVVRVRDAYPVYFQDYQKNLKIIFDYLKGFSNLQVIGRGGLYRYNNMDHSILSGFYAAKNILGAKLDVFSINADQDYLEEKSN